MGANLPGPFGGPEDSLRAAMDAMAVHDINVVSVSRVWLTSPVPVSNQPLYRNAVASVQTRHEPFALFYKLKEIERAFGRAEALRDAPRILDLDILAYDQKIIHADILQIPHPRMHQRAFVLYPLKEIAPDWTHPHMGKAVDEMIAVLPSDQKGEPLDVAA